jgi:LPS sulfotransferase NodH
VRPTCSYLICTTPRSGSWLLAEGLLATGIAGRPEEYFRPDWFARFRTAGRIEYQHRLHRDDAWPDGVRVDTGGGPTTLQPDGNELDRFLVFLDAVVAAGTTPDGVFGAKVHWQQLAKALAWLRLDPGRRHLDDAELLETWLPGLRFVHLRRDDAIRRAVSHYRAIRSDVWWADGTSADGNGAGETALAELGEDDLLEIDRLRTRAEEHQQHWTTFFARSTAPRLDISYEELAVDVAGGVGQVLRFLGLSLDESRIAPPRLRRQSDVWTDSIVHTYITWRRGRAQMRTQDYGPSRT